jgi:hypothetical protein
VQHAPRRWRIPFAAKSGILSDAFVHFEDTKSAWVAAKANIQTALLTRAKDNSPTEHQTRFYVKLEQQNWMDHVRRYGVKDRTLSFGRSTVRTLSSQDLTPLRALNRSALQRGSRLGYGLSLSQGFLLCHGRVSPRRLVPRAYESSPHPGVAKLP